jgi:hypothetical protein
MESTSHLCARNGAMLKALAILAGAAATACTGTICLQLLGLVRATAVHVLTLPAGASLFSVVALALTLEITDDCTDAIPSAPATDVPGRGLTFG